MGECLNCETDLTEENIAKGGEFCKECFEELLDFFNKADFDLKL